MTELGVTPGDHEVPELSPVEGTARLVDGNGTHY